MRHAGACARLPPDLFCEVLRQQRIAAAKQQMLELAAAKGCDTFVTADVKYNRFLAAKELGINLIDADHFCTENVVIPVLQEKLQRQFPDVTFTVSQVLHQTAQTYCP